MRRRDRIAPHGEIAGDGPARHRPVAVEQGAEANHDAEVAGHRIHLHPPAQSDVTRLAEERERGDGVGVMSSRREVTAGEIDLAPHVVGVVELEAAPGVDGRGGQQLPPAPSCGSRDIEVVEPGCDHEVECRALHEAIADRRGVAAMMRWPFRSVEETPGVVVRRSRV